MILSVLTKLTFVNSLLFNCLNYSLRDIRFIIIIILLLYIFIIVCHRLFVVGKLSNKGTELNYHFSFDSGSEFLHIRFHLYMTHALWHKMLSNVRTTGDDSWQDNNHITLCMEAWQLLASDLTYTNRNSRQNSQQEVTHVT